MQNSTLKQYAEDAMRNAGLGSEVSDPRVQRVIDSLVNREETGHEVVAEAGVSMGGNYGRIQQAFIDGGLHEVPTPEPEPALATSDGGEEAPAWFRPFADTVGKLVDLAESRLGARIR